MYTCTRYENVAVLLASVIVRERPERSPPARRPQAQGGRAWDSGKVVENYAGGRPARGDFAARDDRGGGGRFNGHDDRCVGSMFSVALTHVLGLV